jgi:DNA polymerase gamma 1
MSEHIERIEQIGEEIYRDLEPVIHELTRGYNLPDTLPKPDQIRYGYSYWDGFGWVALEQITGFTGYGDLETHGLSSADGVICGVWVGTIPETDHDTIVVYLAENPNQDIQIRDSVIANWNQPFDRQFYGADPYLLDRNTHIDLMGLDLLVRGTPEKWSTNSRSEWVEYCTVERSLKEIVRDVLGVDLDKSVRNDIIKGTSEIGSVLEYCYQDARYTAMIGCTVIPEFLTANPNPITLYGHIRRHQFMLPISEQWIGYYDRVEGWYGEQMRILNDHVIAGLADFAFSGDPWSRCFRSQFPDQYKKPDVKAIRENTQLRERIEQDYPCEELPLYKKLWDEVGPSSVLYALGLRLSWNPSPLENPDQSYPILYDRSNRIWYYEIGYTRYTLENKGDPRKSLATPLCKDYDPEIESGKLVIASPEIRTVLKDTQRWKMFRARIADLSPRKTDQGLVLVPNYKPSGTLTGRAVDRVTLLIGSPKFRYGGSEFMSMIEAREGYRIVQADLDSAELVLAGLIAAWYDGVPDEMQNPFCAANLVGSKEAGTDTHTLNAIACGIDRGIAKNLGYGSTYLQGMKSRIALLERAGLSREVAIEKARVFTESFIEGLAKSYFQGIRLLTENRSSTLLLGKRVPLAYQYSGDEGLTSRVNHNIQALGEDMLNVITAIVESEIGGFSEDCNLILTRHDELVFHCRDHLVDQLSEALQVAHYTTRRAIMDLIGITVDAPDPWMHFQGIDVGNRYRKSPSSRASTVTTTFPEENNEH